MGSTVGEAMKNPLFPQDCIHTYTMYSLRSTHITHELLRNVDIERLSLNVGNSPNVIRSNYNRPIQRLNAKYLANSEAALREQDDGEVMSSLHRYSGKVDVDPNFMEGQVGII